MACSSSRDSHSHMACRTIYDRDQNEIKGSTRHFVRNKAIKEKICESKILIPVANGSIGLIKMTSPCSCTVVYSSVGCGPAIFSFEVSSEVNTTHSQSHYYWIKLVVHS